MSSSNEYATGPAMCECSMGLTPSMIPPSQNTLLVNGLPVLTETDKPPAPFGTCKMKPTPAGPGPCTPALLMWIETTIPGTGDPETVNGLKILLKKSKLPCSLGGIISLLG